MLCADLTGCLLGEFHAPAGLRGSAAGTKTLAKRMANNARLTHEKLITKKIQRDYFKFFTCGIKRSDFFSLGNMFLGIDTCRERELEIKNVEVSTGVSRSTFFFLNVAQQL